MIGIPLKYSFRNLFVRRVTHGLTLLGIGLVVAVFLCLMAMAQGIASVFTASGALDNVVVMRKNADAEMNSSIPREQVAVLMAMAGIAPDTDGRPLASAESVRVLYLEKADGGSSNVTLRGVGEKGFLLRPRIMIVEGRMFQPGVSEVIVSRRVARRFKNANVGDTLRFGSLRWTVVGHFDAGGTAPDSEIWTDADGLMSDFKRDSYSAVLARVVDQASREGLLVAIAGNGQLTLEGRTERAYYEAQTAAADGIKFLGALVGILMAIGASFGAMNTMYAAVSARTREIATLRALGFSRRAILFCFVMESVTLALAGGLLGVALGWLAVKSALSGVSGTTNFVTFSEVVFTFHLTPTLAATGLVASMLIGFLGGLLPASRAAFTPITKALRRG